MRRAILFLSFLLLGSRGLFAADRYVDFSTFRAWRSLAPELAGARVCGLTNAGHELWEKGELRLPATQCLEGDFNRDGREDRAVLLEVGNDPSPCDHVLLVGRRKDGCWERLFLQRIDLEEDAPAAALLWDGKRAAIGIDSGKRKGITSPATMTWKDGKVVEARAGYVLEKKLIFQSIRWNEERKRFEFAKTAVPEEWGSDE